MAPRTVNAGNGWQWIVDGFSLFRTAALPWIALTLLLTIVWIVSLLIPILGPLVFNLFSAVLFAGVLIGCRDVEQGKPLEVKHLLAGFESNVPALVTVGGVHLVGAIAILGVVFGVVGVSTFAAMQPGKPPDLATSMALLRNVLIALVIALVLYTPLIMAIWYAPALIIFDRLGAMDAMKQSFAACWVNMTPFLIYGIALTLLFVVAAIPLLLGLLVLLPVMFCSIYTSYRDIFHPAART